MGNLDGQSTAEIEAPLDVVWALVEEVEKAPEWQGGMKSMHGIERDGDGRAILCEAEVDAKVRGLKSKIRFDYSGAPNRLSWVQEKGDIKSVAGSWELEDLGAERTRATYRIAVDLGRLSLVIRGPLVGVLRSQLAGARAGELKQAVEQG
jgi:carbon monoxide dehydrogenase subunit G